MSGNSSPHRVSHSPYGTPVIPLAAMSESTRQFYDAVRSTRSSLSSPGGSSHGSGHGDDIHPAPTAAHPSSAPPSAPLQPLHRASVGSLASSTPSSSHPSRGGTPPRGTTPTYPSYMRGGLQFFQGVMASPPPPPSTFRGGADIVAPPSASSSVSGEYQPFYPAPPAPHHPATTTPPSPKSLPGTIMHQELGQAGLTWVALNTPPTAEPNRPRFRCRRLFIGQLPFEVTTTDVRRLIFAATGIDTLRLDIRGSGCMLAYYPSDDEAERVKALSGSALFDQGGAWVATTPEQFDVLQQYQVKIQTWTSFFLPRSAMIIEDERRSLHYQLGNAE